MYVTPCFSHLVNPSLPGSGKRFLCLHCCESSPVWMYHHLTSPGIIAQALAYPPPPPHTLALTSSPGGPERASHRPPTGSVIEQGPQLGFAVFVPKPSLWGLLHAKAWGAELLKQPFPGDMSFSAGWLWLKDSSQARLPETAGSGMLPPRLSLVWPSDHSPSLFWLPLRCLPWKHFL